MKPMNPSDVHILLCQLLTKVRADPRLQAELARAEREFFAASEDSSLRDGLLAGCTDQDLEALFTLPAMIRFVEWYLLERESEVLGEQPLLHFLPASESRDCLAESVVGVYLVEADRSGEYGMVDLQDESKLDLLPVKDVPLQVGDLCIGRFYPQSMDTYIASVALAMQRPGAQVAAAFNEDVGRLQLDRKLQQAELEHLLFRGGTQAEKDANQTGEKADEVVSEPTVPLEHLEAELENVLQTHGLTDEEADVSELLPELSATSISTALQHAISPGQLIGPVLEYVAFHSEVDIRILHKLLLDIWAAHKGRQQPAQQQKKEGKASKPRLRPLDEKQPLGEQIAKSIDEKLTSGGGVEQTFAEVEAMLGVDQDGDADAADLPALDGDLEPLIREFLWESKLENSAAEPILQRLLQLQQELPVPRLDLEAITSKDLLRLFLELFLKDPTQQGHQQASEAYALLQGFFAWAEETQQYELGSVLEDCSADFVQQLPRLARASRTLSNAQKQGGATPALHHVVAIQAGILHLAIGSQEQPARMAVDAKLAENLREGDLIVGVFVPAAGNGGTFAGMVVTLPALAEDLLG